MKLWGKKLRLLLMTQSIAMAVTLVAIESSAQTASAWTFCANENQTCSFPGTRSVRYGANSTWVVKTIASTVACNNSVFGDPLPGVAKQCQWDSAWAFCSNQDQDCVFSGTKIVRYGTNTSYVSKTLTGPIRCSDMTFGDPAPGVAKHCDLSNQTVVASPSPTPTPTPTPTPIPTWTFCSNQDQDCLFSGTKIVRYGANTSYFSKTMTGPIRCSDMTFGDPAPGVAKHCDLSNQTVVSSPSPSPTPTPTPTPTSTPAQSPSPTPASTAILPVPSNIANGTTVFLQCGTIYQGTLNLVGKSNVTVVTSGTCGLASISPGRAISGWSLYKGSIYSAALPSGFSPTQISVSSEPMELAHWPNKPQVWAAAGSAVPNTDLIGAKLFSLDTYIISSQTLTSNSASSSKPFYVEGKLWMLDSPGEWVVSNGRIYLWAPNGLSPEGKVWAGMDAFGINADNSSGVTINGVRVFSASNGISGRFTTNLKVLNSEFLNNTLDGVYVSDSTALVVDKVVVTNARRNGISGSYSSSGSRITNSTVRNTGMVGMPTNSQAGIAFFENSKNTFIDNNRVYNSVYCGVMASVGSTVSNNTIDVSNVHLQDGGGIYTNGNSAGNVPLNMLIQGNTVINVTLTGSHAIYLDDFASYVTVIGNTMSNNYSGLFIHDGHDNQVKQNTFSSNIFEHLSFANTSANNVVTGNTFNSTRNELTYHLDGSNIPSIAYATYDNNIYKSTNVSRFAATNGTLRSYSGWKSFTGQDVHSTMNGVP